MTSHGAWHVPCVCWGGGDHPPGGPSPSPSWRCPHLQASAAISPLLGTLPCLPSSMVEHCLPWLGLPCRCLLYWWRLNQHGAEAAQPPRAEPWEAGWQPVEAVHSFIAEQNTGVDCLPCIRLLSGAAPPASFPACPQAAGAAARLGCLRAALAGWRCLDLPTCCADYPRPLWVVLGKRTRMLNVCTCRSYPHADPLFYRCYGRVVTAVHSVSPPFGLQGAGRRTQGGAPAFGLGLTQRRWPLSAPRQL